MSKKNTQVEQVLDYIKKYGSITPFEAIYELGVTRLSARIYELRHYNNVDIETHSIKFKSRNGRVSSYAKYTLKEN